MQKRIVILIISLAYLMFMLFWALLIYDDGRVSIDTLSEIPLTEESDHIIGKVDTAFYDSEQLIIFGWVIQKMVVPSKLDVRIALKENGSDNYIIVPTQLTKRPDVTSYFADGTNYDLSGFMVSINPRSYHSLMQEDQYDIYIVYKTESMERLVPTWKWVEKNAD